MFVFCELGTQRKKIKKMKRVHTKKGRKYIGRRKDENTSCMKSHENANTYVEMIT